MQLLFIRHGDPNYEKDTLTEIGWKEAKLLADALEHKKIDKIYVSPLGRAKDTASLTLERKQMTAEEMPWLREFHAPQLDPTTGEYHIPWDRLPAEWMTDERFYDKDKWCHNQGMLQSDIASEVKKVYDGLDAVLEHHGYVREGNYYRAVQPNTDVIAFFCHYGVTCVMLSHLLNMSPMIPWHSFCAAPTSVTSLYTEERREGIASMRMNCFGDTSHLYVAGEEPSFSARFCEVYSDFTQRHD